jgi:streptomycin 3"-adenylyltransferase
MPQYGWADAPADVRAQMEMFCRAVREALAGNVVGVYLHGSLAMGCFNPERSDIDLLVVTERLMAAETKRDVAQLLLRSSDAPRPIEISFLTRGQLRRWEYPTPFDFHYGEDWRASYETDLASGAWRRWNDAQGRDVDLAAHVTILRHRGLCLGGPPVATVFPDVPPEDYRDSLLRDVAWAREEMERHPVYALLNPCRVLWYLREGRICSKDEAGAWAVDALPEAFRDTLRRALAVYRGEAEDAPFPAEDLKRFAEYVAGQFGAGPHEGRGSGGGEEEGGRDGG